MLFNFRLLNHYQYNKNEAVCIVKQELVEKFINLSNLKLSPKWFALIYKLFPGVQTVRRCVDGKFVYPFHFDFDFSE